MGTPDFFELKTLIHELICGGNNFHPESIKNDNAAIAASNKCVWHEQSRQLHQFRKRKPQDHIRLTELGHYVLVFLFHLNWGSLALHKTGIPKMVIIPSYTNNLSQKFAEHILGVHMVYYETRDLF